MARKHHYKRRKGNDYEIDVTTSLNLMVVLIPFLLDGVAAIRRLNQPDGIHPTAEGHRMLADTVWSELEPVLRAR